MAADKYMQGRNEGMAYALRVAKEKGIEGLEKEVEFRRVTNMPSKITEKQVTDSINEIKSNTFDTMLVMSVMTLKDEFGFGQKRLDKFIERFKNKVQCLVGEYVSWQDMIDTIREENNIELTIWGGKNCE